LDIENTECLGKDAKERLKNGGWETRREELRELALQQHLDNAKGLQKQRQQMTEKKTDCTESFPRGKNSQDMGGADTLCARAGKVSRSREKGKRKAPRRPPLFPPRRRCKYESLKTDSFTEALIELFELEYQEFKQNWNNVKQIRLKQLTGRVNRPKSAHRILTRSNQKPGQGYN